MRVIERELPALGRDMMKRATPVVERMAAQDWQRSPADVRELAEATMVQPLRAVGVPDEVIERTIAPLVAWANEESRRDGRLMIDGQPTPDKPGA